MFNPHIHHQQQQQQFHQHLRQIQQLFQQQVQPPPPQPSAHHVPHAPHAPHAHQAPRAMPVPPQSAPPPRMVNLCQTTQTTIIAPNPMLQGAILMQQMQGNMRGFGMGGQQFRQFFAAGARSSLLGPVPMGVAIKSPMMGFPPARPVYPHVRYYNNTSVPGSSSASDPVASRQSDRKRDIEQITHDTNEDLPGPSTAIEASEAGNIENPNDGDGCVTLSEEQQDEPKIKKQRIHGLQDTAEQPIPCEETPDAVILSSDSDNQAQECASIVGLEVLESELESAEKIQDSSSVHENQHVEAPLMEVPQEENCLLSAENQDEEDVEEGNNKFYCYLCSITCVNQQNFRNHMNSISHQQRMMEIQHMSNACLVTLLPRLQDSLQGTSKDSEKKNELKRWCATCRTHFTHSSMDHRQTKEHKLARKMAISSCTVCKKHFRSSQIFIQHLQTLEHRKKVEMDNQDCEEVSKIPDGLLVEEESGVSEDDESLSNADDLEALNEQDVESSKEVTLEDMDDHVQYDPKVVYGSSFLVPVAGFICRLCNKFYHFESPDLHSHCKSSDHYENLKRYKIDQKYEAGRKCVAESKLNSDISTPDTESSSKQPFVLLHNLQKQADLQQPEEGVEPDEAVQDFTLSAPHSNCTDLETSSVEKTTTTPSSRDQDSTVTDPAVTRDSSQSVSNDGNVEEKGVKHKSKAVTTPKRRTLRATNRR